MNKKWTEKKRQAWFKARLREESKKPQDQQTSPDFLRAVLEHVEMWGDRKDERASVVKLTVPAFHQQGTTPEEEGPLTPLNASDLRRMSSKQELGVFRKALDACELGDLPSGMQVLQQLVTHRPDDPDYLRGYGQALTDAGEPAKALTYLTRSNEIRPGDQTVLMALGNAWSRLGELAKAEAVYKEAIALPLNPKDKAIQASIDEYLSKNLAMVLLRQGKDLPYAEQLARAAIAVSPKAWAQWYVLGRVQADIGHREEAIKSLEHTLELGPTDVAAKEIAETIAKTRRAT